MQNKKIMEMAFSDLKQTLWEQLGEYLEVAMGVTPGEEYLKEKSKDITIDNWGEKMKAIEEEVKVKFKRRVKAHNNWLNSFEPRARARELRAELEGRTLRKPDRELNTWELHDIITGEVMARIDGIDAFEELCQSITDSPVRKQYIVFCQKNNSVYKKRYKFIRIPKVTK
jgi:hypothetical protein